MSLKHLSSSERGATLVVALVMLMLITVLVSSSFSLSTVNLKAVGNTQTRHEALAAANAVLNQVVHTPFTQNPNAAAEDITYDVNQDDVPDYTVNVAIPECIRATLAVAADISSQTITSSMSQVEVANAAGSGSGALMGSTWNTVWMLRATVNDAVTGAQTMVNSSVRVQMSAADKDKVCN